MTDDLEAVRATRANVPPPTRATRDAARARWDAEPVELATAAAGRAGVRTFTVRTAIAGAVAVAIVAGAFFVTRARINSVKPQHVVSAPGLTDTAASGPQVFLLVGSDSRAFVKSGSDVQKFGDPQGIAGQRADTMMLVRIDPTGSTVVVSLPRDLWVDIPGCGMNKLNAAFALTCGGINGTALLVDTITKDLGVGINHVIEVQFPQFAAVVDQLGGLRISFPVPTMDKYTGLNQGVGCVTLNGEQALAFVRSRHYEHYTDGRWVEDPTADLGREARQQLALRQLAAAAESRLGTDPRPLLRALFSSVTVDTGFTADDALRYFRAMRRNDPTVMSTLPVRSEFVDDQDVLVPDQPGVQRAVDVLNGHGEPAGAAISGPTPPAASAAAGFEPTAC